jgi:hypothetical protein
MQDRRNPPKALVTLIAVAAVWGVAFVQCEDG